MCTRINKFFVTLVSVSESRGAGALVLEMLFYYHYSIMISLISHALSLISGLDSMGCSVNLKRMLQSSSNPSISESTFTSKLSTINKRVFFHK